MSKISIRFYNDQEERAVWDEDKSQWWFSAVDIVTAITESLNPRKYRSVLKTRLKQSGSELTTRCSQLKLPSVDGTISNRLPFLYYLIDAMPCHPYPKHRETSETQPRDDRDKSHRFLAGKV